MQHAAHVCRNGMTALVAPLEKSSLVSLQVWVGTGSVHEAEFAGAGISHLLEHMVFKGTAEYSGQELNERVPALGGLWNAYTSTDRTVYHIDGPAAHWREFLHLLVQLTLHPSFPEEEYERERDVIRREMAMYDDDPQDAAYHALIGTLYKKHPRRLPVVGYRSLFDRLTHADMAAYHARRYVPANMFICAAGDVDSAAFFAAVEEEMADIPAAPAAEVPLPQESRQWGLRLCRREFAQPTSTLMLAWRIPHANHADAAALSMLGSVLGDGRTAWLYRRFHDELGLAHDISVMTIPDRTGEGALVIEADAERDRRDALRDAITAFVSTLPQADFEESRARTRRQMRVAKLKSLATVQGLAQAAAMSWHLTRNAGCMEEWEDALDRVTAADLARVAAAYLTPDRLTEVSVDPLGSNAEQAEDAAAEQGSASELHTLPNGLRVAVRVDRRVPLVYLNLTVGAGSSSETAETAGINTLLCECLLKGTTTRSAAELADAVENLGASLNSSAGNNTFSLSSRGLAGDADTLITLLADAALHPTFPAEALETEKEALIADILDAAEDPAATAFRRLRQLCFGSVSYGNHRDGTVESVESLTREQLQTQHARLMCGHNAVLAVVGDIDPAAVLAAASAAFGDMPAGMPVQRVSTPAQQAADERVIMDKEQAVLAVAMPALNATAAELPQQVLFEEWCRDMAGPVCMEIREKRGLAYYASATSLLGVDAGCLYFYLGTAPQQVAEARAAMEQLLADLAEHGMPAEALERSRATALAARLLSLQSGSKRCAGMAVNTLLGLGADYDDTVPDLLRAVTPESMSAFLRRTLSPAATRTWVTVTTGKVGS